MAAFVGREESSLFQQPKRDDESVSEGICRKSIERRSGITFTYIVNITNSTFVKV